MNLKIKQIQNGSLSDGTSQSVPTHLKQQMIEAYERQQKKLGKPILSRAQHGFGIMDNFNNKMKKVFNQNFLYEVDDRMANQIADKQVRETRGWISYLKSKFRGKTQKQQLVFTCQSFNKMDWIKRGAVYELIIGGLMVLGNLGSYKLLQELTNIRSDMKKLFDEIPSIRPSDIQSLMDENDLNEEDQSNFLGVFNSMILTLGSQKLNNMHVAAKGFNQVIGQKQQILAGEAGPELIEIQDIVPSGQDKPKINKKIQKQDEKRQVNNTVYRQPLVQQKQQPVIQIPRYFTDSEAKIFKILAPELRSQFQQAVFKRFSSSQLEKTRFGQQKSQKPPNPPFRNSVSSFQDALPAFIAPKSISPKMGGVSIIYSLIYRIISIVVSLIPAVGWIIIPVLGMLSPRLFTWFCQIGTAAMTEAVKQLVPLVIGTTMDLVSGVSTIVATMIGNRFLNIVKTPYRWLTGSVVSKKRPRKMMEQSKYRELMQQIPQPEPIQIKNQPEPIYINNQPEPIQIKSQQIEVEVEPQPQPEPQSIQLEATMIQKEAAMSTTDETDLKIGDLQKQVTTIQMNQYSSYVGQFFQLIGAIWAGKGLMKL